MEPVLLLPEHGGGGVEPFLKAQARRCVGEPQEAGAVGELHEVKLDFKVHGLASVEVKHFQHPIQTDNLSLVLLIAALCIHHDVALTTFDAHFAELGKLSKLRVNLLIRPA